MMAKARATTAKTSITINPMPMLFVQIMNPFLFLVARARTCCRNVLISEGGTSTNKKQRQCNEKEEDF